MKLKEQILRYLENLDNGSIAWEQMAEDMGITQKDSYLFFTELTNMKKAGLVIKKRNGEYALADSDDKQYEGVIRTHKKGFGFIKVDDVEDEYFVRPVDIHGALDGDIVIFKLVIDRLHPEKSAAVVVAIKERANQRQVGTVIEGDADYFYLQIDNNKFNGEFLLKKSENTHLVIGHKVVVVPEEYLADNQIVGRVVEIFGHVNSPSIDILSIVKQHDIETEFSAEVEASIEEIPAAVDPAEMVGREDLRDVLTITIDGADAKDLDDAISLSKNAEGNSLLTVHIADVSHYVTPDSAIDMTALARGTSVYLADRVIPMLPVQLSNGICSLHPHIDRLAISCEMEIDYRGLIVKKRIFPSVIYSDERMTYDDVNRMLDDESDKLIKKYKHIYPMLLEMEELAQILKTRHHANGALDFAISEAKIIVDETGKAVDIAVRTQGTAEELIEQFMIVANEAVASSFMQAELPFIYRVHGLPKDVKLDAFRQAASNMGISVANIKSTSSIKPKALQLMLENIQQKDEFNLLSTLLLRTMQKAEYSTENIGHFGLAIRNYTHFTSPIRRYPDLIVHRLIRHYLFDEQQFSDDNEKLRGKLKVIAHDTSVAERRAIDCERAVTSMKMAEYMQDHVGEKFYGIISGVMNSGFFVELDNLVEGKVRIETLRNDYYIYIPEQLMLLGRRTKKQFRMGDRVEVKVDSANKGLAEINFVVLSNFSRKKHWKPDKSKASNSKSKVKSKAGKNKKKSYHKKGKRRGNSKW